VAQLPANMAALIAMLGQANAGFFSLGTSTALTIATGAVTATRSRHTLLGQGGVADDLDTVSGGAEGYVLVLRADSESVTITVKDATGNMKLAGDFALTSKDDQIMLIHDGTNWLEIDRSDNTA
jgi:hypothetical protein